jgi:hypothetical protein
MQGYVIWFAVGFLIGLFFVSTWRVVLRFLRGGIESLRKKNGISSTSGKYQAKLVATLSSMLAISAASWAFGYYATQRNLDPIWEQIAAAIFGVSSAGLLGGIVFEAFLRREILTEVSETLADIVTTDKSVAKEIFTRDKRNKILETMLQINLDSDLYGTALYEDLVARYTQGAHRREFRFGFTDRVTFCQISQEHENLTGKYYEVIDRISYRSELRSSNFIVGCASDEDQLYALFNDRASIYRWMLKDPDFENLMKSGRGFSVSLSVAGQECRPMNGEGELTRRGFEIHFENIYAQPNAPYEFEAQLGQIVDFELEIHTLHPVNEKVLSIHLAYPVKGAEISFDYEDTSIQDVTRLHFLTAGEYGPRVVEGVKPKLASARRSISVIISDDHWLFPDSGVVFAWD